MGSKTPGEIQSYRTVNFHAALAIELQKNSPPIYVTSSVNCIEIITVKFDRISSYQLRFRCRRRRCFLKLPLI